MRKLWQVAALTGKLRAVSLCMNLQLRERLPHDERLAVTVDALVRKLAEIDAVFEHFVDFLEEIALGTTVGAALVCLDGPPSVIELGFIGDLKLAVLAEKLVAFDTLLRLEWKLLADHTLDFFNHFSLEFVLDF